MDATPSIPAEEHRRKIAEAMRGNKNAQKAQPIENAATAPAEQRTKSEYMRGNKNAQKPEVIRTSVVVKAVQGETNTQIAKDLGISRTTVGRILSESEVDERVKEGRSKCVEMIPKALVAVESGLDKRDWRAGLGLLRGTNVLTNGSGSVNQTNVQANVWVQMRAQRDAELSGTQGTQEPKPLALAAAVPLPDSSN